jgi:hypothetical protein
MSDTFLTSSQLQPQSLQNIMTTSKPSTPLKNRAASAKCTTPDAGYAMKVAPSGVVSPAGFSPRRLNKPEGLAMDKKDTYFIVAIKGGIIEIIFLDSKRNKANDGYFPFVTGLATDGNGEYKVRLNLQSTNIVLCLNLTAT